MSSEYKDGGIDPLIILVFIPAIGLVSAFLFMEWNKGKAKRKVENYTKKYDLSSTRKSI
ncbi:MAG: hypothetical protein ACFFAE_21835 [Candidatus Hodarchaeota archaeon]